MLSDDPYQQAALARSMQMASNAASLSRPPAYASPPTLDIAGLIAKLASSTQSGNRGRPNLVGSGNGFRGFKQAIKGQESGNNYSAVNSDSGALGAFQVLPSNIGPWSQDVLGHSITPERFLASRRLQNIVAGGKLRDYFNNYGAAGAASAWYSGDPSLWNNRDSQGNYPSIHDYVLEILHRMGRR